MSDRLDNLLGQLPPDPLPEDLIVRVQARLHARRSLERWTQRAQALALAASAALGTWLLLFSGAGVGNLGLPGLTADVWLQWFSGAASSPQSATLQAASGALAWGDWLSSQMNLPVLLALILLAAPATAILIALLRQPAGRRGAMA